MMQQENEQLRQQITLLEQRITTLDQFLETAPLATIEFNRDGIVTAWNQSAEHIFGWAATEAIGQPLLFLVVPPIDIEQLYGDSEVLQEDLTTISRNDQLTRDGRTITCQWYITPLRDEHARISSFLAQAEDVTIQVRQQDEAFVFKAMAELAPDMIGLVDLVTMQLIYTNRAYCDLLGYDDAIIGLSLTTVFAEDAPVIETIVKATREQGFWTGTSSYRCADGPIFPVFVTSFIVRNQSGVSIAIAMISHDITEQHRAEQERADLQEQVILAQKSALRELSTPLLPIADNLLIMPLVGAIDSQRA